ncbi:hypothetical protein ACIBEJ_32025 [Nonomuraea sp. NPDC050790]|uniref:hypothetical protein n=1 Tax=Nonomuraea sp. NPDC050790 TaxID=3364371 RepID=UPI0037A6C824
MIGHHLRRAVGARYLLALLPAGWLTWVGFRPGGTEVGDAFGPWGLARYWAVVTALLAVAVVPLLGPLWQERRLRAGWRLAAASPWAVGKDRFRVFLAGFLVYAAAVVVCALFVGRRLYGAGDWLPSLLVVTAVGPLLGGYVLLACCYAINSRWGPAPAIGLAVVMGSLDLANVLPAVLSLSGTGDVARMSAAWAITFEEPSFTRLPLPAWPFLAARLVAAVGGTALVLSCRRHVLSDHHEERG